MLVSWLVSVMILVLTTGCAYCIFIRVYGNQAQGGYGGLETGKNRR